MRRWCGRRHARRILAVRRAPGGARSSPQPVARRDRCEIGHIRIDDHGCALLAETTPVTKEHRCSPKQHDAVHHPPPSRSRSPGSRSPARSRHPSRALPRGRTPARRPAPRAPSTSRAPCDRTARPRSPSSPPAAGYRVTRCGADGSAVVSQTVSPIAGPDGATVLVPTERVERGVTVAMLYGDPADPRWAAEFRARARRSPRRSSRRRCSPRPRPPRCRCPAARAPTAARPGERADDADPATARAARATAPLAPAPAGQVAVAAVAGDACTNSQFATLGDLVGDARLQLLRQPQPLQLQRHVGRVDRRRTRQLGHDVQQLRPQRHHGPRLTSPRVDEPRRSTRTPTAGR